MRGDILTIRKSIKLLTKVVAYGAMILWVLLLTAILSTPAKAQNASTNPIVEYVDHNLYKVLTDHDGYYHVNAAGVPNGSFKQVSVAGNVTMIATGEMMNGKKIGRVIYTANGKRIMIRYYNSDGILVKSTRIHVSIEAQT